MMQPHHQAITPSLNPSMMQQPYPSSSMMPPQQQQLHQQPPPGMTYPSSIAMTTNPMVAGSSPATMKPSRVPYSPNPATGAGRAINPNVIGSLGVPSVVMNGSTRSMMPGKLWMVKEEQFHSHDGWLVP